MNETPIRNPFDEDERSGRRPILWAILGLAAMCGGLVFAAALFYFQPDVKSLYGQYFPTPTFTPRPTSTSSPTPNLTATAQILQATETVLAYQAFAESAANDWQIIRTDTFDTNDNNWLVESSDDEYSFTDYQIVDGKYRWEATAHQSFIGWVRSDKDLLTDFYLSVDVQKMEGPGTADYGVIFREDNDSNFYYFGINDHGAYILYVYLEGWNTLVEWTNTDLIKPGESNRITVIGKGSHFIFFINDQYLMEITDDKIPEGSTAIAIELDEDGDHAIIEFDNYELREP